MNHTSGLYLLLAAGFSRRFGSAKLLHPLPSGDAIISSTIRSLKASCCNFVVIIRENDKAMLAHLSKLNVAAIKVNNADKGLSSVIAGAVNKLNMNNIDWLGICLADMPYIRPSTFVELSTQASTSAIVRPRYLMQLGHPVLFGRDYFSRLKKLEGDDGAKSILKAHANALHIIDVTDPMIVYDIDEHCDIISAP